MSEKINHYEDKATQAITHANNAGTIETITFWTGSAQVAATLALVGAIQELTKAVKAGRS